MRFVRALYLIGLLLFAPTAEAEALFDPSGGGPTPLLYLHPMVDYELPPDWDADYERERFREGGIRLSVGSVSTKDFLTRVELNLREPLHPRLRFLYELDWYEALHVDRNRQRHLIGLEFAASEVVALQFQAHPAGDKEDLDLQAGLLLTDSDRERYLRVALRFDDLVYEAKNDRGAEVDTRPLAFVWQARWVRGAWEADSQGDFGNRSSLSFPDSTATPEFAASEGFERDARASLRRRTDSSLMELRYQYVSAGDACLLRGDSEAEAVESELHDLSLRANVEFSRRYELRGELHRIWQEATGRGPGTYDYGRDEWIPALFFCWLPAGWNRLEAGAMTTFYDFDSLPDRDAESGSATKLKLGWYLRLKKTARLGFSLSHEPDPQRFGGGNIQFQVLF